MDFLEKQQARHNLSGTIEGCNWTSSKYPETKAKLLKKQFQSTYTREDLSYLPDKGPSPHSPMKIICINSHGVHKLLRGFKLHKATGPDMILARFLKDYAMELSNILTKLFQFSIDR